MASEVPPPSAPKAPPIELSELISKNAPPKDPSAHYLLFSTLAQPCARDSFVMGLGVGIGMIPLGIFIYRKQLNHPDINVKILRLALWPFVLTSMGSWIVCRETYFERVMRTEQWKAMTALRERQHPSTVPPKPT